jgi:hypothetical protein
MSDIEKLEYTFKWEIIKILISFPLYPNPYLHHEFFDLSFT